jgi:hypothetical protein
VSGDGTPVIDGATVPSRATGSVQAEVDGELILLSPRDFGYFGAEGAGAEIWSLVDGERSVDVLVAELNARFEAPEDQIRADVIDFVTALVASGLVEV